MKIKVFMLKFSCTVNSTDNNNIIYHKFHSLYKGNDDLTPKQKALYIVCPDDVKVVCIWNPRR